MNLDRLSEELGFEHIEFRHTYQNDPSSSCPGDYGSEFIKKWSTQIVGMVANSEGIEIGHVVSFVFLTSYAVNADKDIIEAADELSQELCNCAEIMYGSDSLESTEIIERSWDNCLYIDSLFVNPKYRGHNLGALALRRTIEHLDPASLCAVILRPTAKALLKDNDPLKKVPDDEASKKLVAFYRQLGFTRFKKTPYMYLDMERYIYDWRTKNLRSPICRRIRKSRQK